METQRVLVGEFSQGDEAGIGELVRRIPEDGGVLILEKAASGKCALYSGRLPEGWVHGRPIEGYENWGACFVARFLRGQLGVCAREIERGNVGGYMLVRDTSLANMSGFTDSVWIYWGKENEPGYSEYVACQNVARASV